MKKQKFGIRIGVLLGLALSSMFLFNAQRALSVAPFPGTMDADTIPKFADPLYIMPLMNDPTTGDFTMNIGMYPIQQQYHANWPLTDMFGYGRSKATAHSPANTIAALRGTPIHVNWSNNLVDANNNFLVHPLDIDQTIPWADPYLLNQGPGKGGKVMTAYKGPIPTVVHLHGGEVDALSDGHYMSWFTPDCNNAPTYHGSTWECTGQSYTYANEQKAALIWYHDHAFGLDRQNVMMGLFGGYVIIDPHDGIEHNPALGLNGGGGIVPTADAYDIPLIVQDRMLYDGTAQIAYLGNITNPDVHPIWFPEFFGNIIVVNGKVWPYQNVESRKYRLRFLNGSNARFYHFYFSDGVPLDVNNNVLNPNDPNFATLFDHYRQINLPFLQIATDGGFMKNAVQVNDFLDAPAERFEFIVDFSAVPDGLTDVYLVNDAPGPYPSGDPVSANTAMIMKFHLIPSASDDSYITLADGSPLETVATLTPTVVHNVVLFEKEGPGGPLAMFLDGVDMSDPRSIYHPVIGTTEEWNIINTTMDAHPMHWHLTQFQCTGRQSFMNYMMDMNGNMIFDAGGNPIIDPNGFLAQYKTINPILPIPYDAPINTLDVTPFLMGTLQPPDANEVGAWKDTWKCPPGVVSHFVTSWTQQDGAPYTFDATDGPGYVWHCHILEHEENAMMREVHPVKPSLAPPTSNMALWLDADNQEAIGQVNYTNMMPVMNHWNDKSGLGNNAVQPDYNKSPMHDSYGYNCKDATMFVTDPSYGYSDFFQIPYKASITSSNPNAMVPVGQSKTLFVPFEFMMDPMMGGRQTIFEAGGTVSGFNLYVDNGKLMAGMWNRLERRYVMFNSVMLQKETYYLAALEYDAAKGVFRVSLDGNNVSPLMRFQGLSQNISESGIGAEVNGTRYHDYAMGNNWGNTFMGDIPEVLLYNTYDPALSQQAMAYLSEKYHTPWAYTPNPLLKEGWITFEETENVPDNQHLISAYPNPFNDNSQFSIKLSEEQAVNIELYNSLGQVQQVINSGKLPAGTTQFSIDGTNLTPGMYVVKATGNGFTESNKVVFIR